MRLSTRGRTINYDVAGVSEETVVFINALGASREMWQPQVPFFASHYRVVTYDYRASPQTIPAHSLADFADDLLSLMDHLAVPRAHVVGLSMGGMVAQVFGVEHAGRTISLALASTTATYPEQSREQLRQRAETAERDGMGPLVEATVSRWFTPEFASQHPGTVAWIRQMLADADPQEYAAAARAVADVNTVPRLHEIMAPTLVLTAEFDQSMPADAAQILLAWIPKARKASIPAAHLSNVGDLEGFNQEVSQFIASAATGGV